MKLLLPSEEYYRSYRAAIGEYREHDVDTYTFLDLDSTALFQLFDDHRVGRALPAGYVRATYLWLVEQGEFVGEVAIRHSLTPALLRFGGHISYGVRVSRWGEGRGTKLLGLALVYARETLGLGRVLITCNDDNYASARVIEKNGGVMQDKLVNTKNGVDRLTRRYWIQL